MIRYTCKSGVIVQFNNVIPNRMYCVSLYWGGKRVYVEYFFDWDTAYSYFEDMSGLDYEQ